MRSCSFAFLFYHSVQVLLLQLHVQPVTSFAPQPRVVTGHSVARTTAVTPLRTGAWLEEPRDKKKSSSSSSSTSEVDPRDVDPKANFQQWIQKWQVDHRRYTTGNLLVSGNRLIDQFMGEGKDSYADPEILYMLMEEQYNFKFDKIYICSYDMDDAKKRLISRKARYTGLLDKLEFIETDFPWDPEHPEVFNIPTAEQIKQHGITNWIMLQDYDHEWMTEKAFEVAKASDGQLKNVVMTMMDYYLDEDTTIPLINRTWDTLGGPRHRKWLEPELSDPERYQKGDVQFTFLVCGCPTDDPEGGADWVYDDLLISSDEDLRRAKEGGYDFIDGDTLKKMGYKGAFLAENWDRISQHQMMRFTVDALDLACFSGRAISFKDMWDPISKRVQKPMKSVITGMRSAGFTSVEIMDHIFDKFIDLVRDEDSWVQRKRQLLACCFGVVQDFFDSPFCFSCRVAIQVGRAPMEEEGWCSWWKDAQELVGKSHLPKDGARARGRTQGSKVHQGSRGCGCYRSGLHSAHQA
jgi:hypothetical protein